MQSLMGEMRTGCNILVGKLEGKKQLWRTRRWWKDNIRMDLKEIVLECVVWIHVAQNRDQWRDVVNAVMNFRIQ